MRRISSNLQHDDIQAALRRQEARTGNLNNQISNHRKIQNLRDDPLAAGHAVRYQSYLARLERFETNGKTAIDRFSFAEGNVNQSLQIMHRVRELALTGAHGTFTPEDMKNIAVEVDQLLQELVQNANVQGPDGSRVFAGTKSFTEPFETVLGDVDGAGNPLIREVRYNGSVQGSELEIDELGFLEAGFPGNQTFWAEQQTLFSEVDASAFIAKTDSSFDVDGIRVPVSAGDNVHSIIAKINDSGAAVKAYLDPVTNGLNMETTDAHQLWLSDSPGGDTLSSLGIIKTNQRPPYNLSPSTKISGGSLFDTVIALRDALMQGDQEAVGSRVLGSLDAGIDNLATRLSDIGSRYERTKATIARLEVQQINTTAAESREADIDFTKAVTDLKMYELAQQATLSTAGKLYSNTLLNYMR